MSKRIILFLLSSVLLLTGLTLATPSPAHAGDQRPCVSLQEYRDIRWQWPPATKARVTDHFDLYGYRVDAWGSYYHRDAIWTYRRCPEWGGGRVFVWFDNYTWGDYQPTHRVYAMAPSYGAYTHWDWTYIQ